MDIRFRAAGDHGGRHQRSKEPTCAMLETILTQAGCTGVYTSPRRLHFENACDCGSASWAPTNWCVRSSVEQARSNRHYH
jgi:hypothetical protein